MSVGAVMWMYQAKQADANHVCSCSPDKRVRYPSPSGRAGFLASKLMNKRRCFRIAEEGHALVETVLVMPLLLTMLFAVMEFGAILYDKSLITTASREAARTAVLIAANAPSPITSAGFDPASQMPKISAAATDIASQLVGKGATPTVNAVVSAPDSVGTKVAVTVSYTYPTIVLSAFGSAAKRLLPKSKVPLFPSPFVISSTTAMYFQ